MRSLGAPAVILAQPNWYAELGIPPGKGSPLTAQPAWKLQQGHPLAEKALRIMQAYALPSRESP